MTTPDLDLSRSYNSIGESIYNLFARREQGFFVPEYQREYTWEEDNINQLFDDLLLGIQELCDEDGDNAATFLGTVIFTELIDKSSTVAAGEDQAQPTGVRVVIDGQQRISTFALVAIQIIGRLKILQNDLPDEPPYTILKDHSVDLISQLRLLYSLDLGRGSTPPNKPKIIHASEDYWTHSGDDNCYVTPVAHYIADYIRNEDLTMAFESVDSVIGARVRGNASLISNLLDEICNAHLPGTPSYDRFPIGARIATDRIQELVLGFKNESLAEIVGKAEADSNNPEYFASAIYQVFLLAFYLLKRCGVNRLLPANDDWGFDMFQALNATGTPLTAMETFLPQIIKAELGASNEWQGSISRTHMDDINELFEPTTTNEQKNRRTNELLGAFALFYEGKKLGNKFSAQRRWITSTYEKDLPAIGEKQEFLGKMARVSDFFSNAWYMQKVVKPHYIYGLEENPEGELASFLVQFLKDANSHLSTPILARFYCQALEGETSFDEFVEAAKACAAFFALWRSANSTSGLDDIYRKFLSGSDAPIKVDSHNWKARPKSISSNELKDYFFEVLKSKSIDEMENWITQSTRFLVYTEVKTICRFMLFLAGDDQVGGGPKPGLTTAGTLGVCPLLTLEKWVAGGLKSVEHVAPQNPPTGHGWDPSIYSEGKVQEIGNLMLLPIQLNQFVGNNNWAVKHLYYSHVGERVQAKLEQLDEEAKKNGIVLSNKATKELSSSNYSCTVEAVLNLGAAGQWNTELIDDRTRQIKELDWNMLISWLKT